MVSKIVLVSMVLFLAACSSAPTRKPVPAPESPKATEHEVIQATGARSASSVLLDAARQSRLDSDFGQAESLLQRAQRIDTSNSEVYLEFARLYSDTGQQHKVEAMLEKGLQFCRQASCLVLRELLEAQ